MIEHVLKFTLPAAYSLLPERMAAPAASALLLAIGLQESQFLARRQSGTGPARGFWQFERGGVAGVMHHPTAAPLLSAALYALRYEKAVNNPSMVTALLEDNDTLAAVVARLLLYTLPDVLPVRETPAIAWKQYLAGWRPGKPIAATWEANFGEGWDRVETALQRVPSPLVPPFA